MSYSLESDFGPFYIGDPMFFVQQPEYTGDESQYPEDPWLELCSRIHDREGDVFEKIPMEVKIGDDNFVIMPCPSGDYVNIEIYTELLCVTQKEPFDPTSPVKKFDGGKINISLDEITLDGKQIFA